MSRLKFDNSNGNNNSNKKNGKYKVKAIRNSVVYAKESKKDQLLGVYYLVL